MEGGDGMKIEEARQVYSAQIKAYYEKQKELSKQKKELEHKINTTPNGKTIYANEAATLELTTKAVEEKQTEYKEYMENLMEQWATITNMVSTQQQNEAMEEHIGDLAKVFEVARRLMKGAIVPAKDEKKLMEFSMEMYQAAKNIGAMAKKKEKEEYDSLWDDKEKGITEPEDPMEVANNSEAFAKGPEIVDVADTVASVVVE